MRISVEEPVTARGIIEAAGWTAIVLGALVSYLVAFGCSDSDDDPPKPPPPLAAGEVFKFSKPVAYDEYGYPMYPLAEAPLMTVNPRTYVNENDFCWFAVEVLNNTASDWLVTLVGETWNSDGVWTGQGWGGSRPLAAGGSATFVGNVIDERTPERLYPRTCSAHSRATVSYIALDQGDTHLRFVDPDVYEKIGDPQEKIGNHGYESNDRGNGDEGGAGTSY